MAVSARKLYFGRIEVDRRAVRITGLGSATTIPIERITSVNANRLTGKLTIETGAQVHRVQLWNGRRVPLVAEAIEAQRV